MPKVLLARPAGNAAEEKKGRPPAGARHASADWIQRARIIALSWGGHRVLVIAELLGCHEKTVRRWLHRFNTGCRAGPGGRRRYCRVRRCRRAGSGPARPAPRRSGR
ncbi:helix-turn-helix domain-containing protein [Streptomyces sp. NPDC059161]|uniref:helix-turn-helix domain-containing protein n=1 Tax=unclassified Streptomyces TaxID=2593676 RepID=UPI00364C45A7